MDTKLITTAFELPAYTLEENLGISRGVIVRSRSVVGNIGASLQSLVGGNITAYTKLCEKTREDSFELMIKHAMELGANAIIGVRYESNDLAPGITEVLCYGTAVRVSRK